MQRRDALKRLAALATATGIRMTPITVTELQEVEGVILRMNGRVSAEMLANVRNAWTFAWQGTRLERVPLIVVDDTVKSIEFLRK